MAAPRSIFLRILALVCGVCAAIRASATGVPISGFYPLAGISLTDKYNHQDDITVHAETTYSGSPLSTTPGAPNFDVALIDTGAATTLITSSTDAAFNIQGAGFRGTNTFGI